MSAAAAASLSSKKQLKSLFMVHTVMGLDTCSEQTLTQDHWMCVTAVVAEQLEHHHKLTPCLLQPTRQAFYPLH